MDWRALKRLLEVGNDHAVFVDAHAQVLRLLVLPGAQRAHEGRRFGDDGVAVVEQDAADQVQPLHRAGRDQHVLFGDLDAAFPAQAFGDDLAQRGQPFTWPVWQHVAPVFEDRLREGTLERFEGIQLRGRLPAAEADQVLANAQRGRIGYGAIDGRVAVS